jgi:hypothetical protein
MIIAVHSIKNRLGHPTVGKYFKLIGSINECYLGIYRYAEDGNSDPE